MEATPALVAGFGVAGYRSIYDDLLLFAPLRKVNLIAGQNNSGKSNILRFATSYLDAGAPWVGSLETLDVPQTPDGHIPPFQFAVAASLQTPHIAKLLADTEQTRGVDTRQALEEVMRAEAFRLTSDDLFWIRYVAGDGEFRGHQEQMRNAIHDIGSNALAALSAKLTSHSGGGEFSDLGRILAFLNFGAIRGPVVMIDAFRRIREAGTGESTALGYDGKELIGELRSLQNPSAENRKAKTRFVAINRFVQSVLGDDKAMLEVPHHAKTINIARGDSLLPLENYGTGVHQVVILAVAATILENTVVCIEEPEVHLHPVMQRKLVRYLLDNTSNQYLIATHSAHLLDYELAAVFGVRSTPSAGTTVVAATSPVEVSEICNDLGYRPSDILQANSVIWVEGPSDRIYVRRWIETCDPTLIEGIHYSIMFYGGRLLSHLSATDPEVDEFISLRRLNRHLVVLIDSDRASPNARINATKRRIVGEFGDGRYPGMAWVTDGYTIENYVPAELLKKAARRVSPSATLLDPSRKWSNPLKLAVGRGKATTTPLDKVKVAHAVCEEWLDDKEWPAHLKRQMRELVAVIHAANGL